MSRYIDADKLTFSRVRIIHPDGTAGGWNAVVMSSVINNAPTENVAPIADTVRKMQEKLYYKFCKPPITIDEYFLSQRVVPVRDIVQIVKEILEEG